MTTKTRKATKGVITDWVQYTVLVALQVILMPVILNVAGSDVLGAYSIIMQVIGYGLILDFGVSVALNRYLCQSYGENHKFVNFKKFINIGRVFIFVINLILSIFIIVLTQYLDFIIDSSASIQQKSEFSLYIFAAWALLRSPLVLYGNALIATQNMAVANNISLLSGLSRLSMSLIFVYFEFGIVGLVFANIMSELLGLWVKRLYFYKLCPEIKLAWCFPDFKLFREVFSFGITYWGVNVAIVLSTGSDSILIGYLYGTTAVAIFYTTKIPTFLIIQAIFKIADNSAPAINELYAKYKSELIISAYLKILRYSLLLAGPFALGIIGFNAWVISAWVGIEHYAGNLMSAALALFVLTQVINHINAMITVAFGKMKHWITLSISSGTATIVLGYFLAKAYGFQWVMVAIVLMEVPAIVFLTWRSFNCMKLEIGMVLNAVIRPTLFVIAPLAIWTSLTSMLVLVNGLASLIVCMSVYSLIWVLSTYNFGLNNVERAYVKGKIQTLMWGGVS
jgi:O-antigen/teichoic acid export membrane protein